MGPYYLEEVRRQLVESYGEDYGLRRRPAGAHRHGHGPSGRCRSGLGAGLVETAKRHGWQGPVRHIDEGEYEEFLGARKDVESKPGDWMQVLVTWWKR